MKQFSLYVTDRFIQLNNADRASFKRFDPGVQTVPPSSGSSLMPPCALLVQAPGQGLQRSLMQSPGTLLLVFKRLWELQGSHYQVTWQREGRGSTLRALTGEGEIIPFPAASANTSLDFIGSVESGAHL